MPINLQIKQAVYRYDIFKVKILISRDFETLKDVCWAHFDPIMFCFDFVNINVKYQKDYLCCFQSQLSIQNFLMRTCWGWNKSSSESRKRLNSIYYAHDCISSCEMVICLPYTCHYNLRFVYFYPIFHCGLYCRAASVTDNLCTKQGNSSIFGSKIRSL